MHLCGNATVSTAIVLAAKRAPREPYQATMTPGWWGDAQSYPGIETHREGAVRSPRGPKRETLRHISPCRGPTRDLAESRGPLAAAGDDGRCSKTYFFSLWRGLGTLRPISPKILPENVPEAGPGAPACPGGPTEPTQGPGGAGGRGARSLIFDGPPKLWSNIWTILVQYLDF